MNAQAKSDIVLGAVTTLIVLGLLIPSYQQAAQVFMLPGDISPFLVPKLFLFICLALSTVIFFKGIFTLRSEGKASEPRNWKGILGVLIVVVVTTCLMKPLGFIVVTPIAVFLTCWLLDYRRHLINATAAFAITGALYLLLVTLAGLTLPQAFWIG